MFASTLFKTTSMLQRPSSFLTTMIGTRFGYASVAAAKTTTTTTTAKWQPQQLWVLPSPPSQSNHQLITKIEKLSVPKILQEESHSIPLVHNRSTPKKSVLSEMLESLVAGNRNARVPGKANKGKRPCSRVRRRNKKKAIGKWRR
mmetsp:Transcript_18344/g.25875  ORF Transcript_18344/g.25875 Transcript_18344/m.25875 type:complete len:145 (+) Transcript_18344:177-611(+)